VNRKIAVIQLPSFYADSRRGGRSSAEDVKKLLKKAREAKADGVLLDLSTNGGGSLDDAVGIVGLFIQSGNVVKQSTRKTAELPDSSTLLQDTDPVVHWAGPLVILTSRVSASASEIVAGALQDYKRAVVVGSDHTFGKGTVQQVVQLPPGLGAIKVTVGMFFTPGGWSTQHRGVNSDIQFPFPHSTLEIGEKELDHSLQPQKISPFLSASAQSKENPWKEITPETVSLLKQTSSVRVANNAKFKEIIEENKKAQTKEPRVISLSETFEERKEMKEKREQSRTQTKEEKLAEYLAGAEVTEAANVLVDLIDLQNKVKLSIANENKTSSAKEKL
jgi:carboxyl-terminal processing protease